MNKKISLIALFSMQLLMCGQNSLSNAAEESSTTNFAFKVTIRRQPPLKTETILANTKKELNEKLTDIINDNPSTYNKETISRLQEILDIPALSIDASIKDSPSFFSSYKYPIAAGTALTTGYLYYQKPELLTQLWESLVNTSGTLYEKIVSLFQ